METCKPWKSPNEKIAAEELAKRLELETVEPHRVSQYRSLTMRAAFLAQDRPDISECVKCFARKMQAPTEADFGDVKRLARYIKGNMRMVQKFEPQKFSSVVTGHADSDFAGCLLTRHYRADAFLRTPHVAWLKQPSEYSKSVLWRGRVLRVGQRCCHRSGDAGVA